METDQNNFSSPWEFLEQFRGEAFTGTWPTLPELFRISTIRYADRACFTTYDPSRVTLTYREALRAILGLADVFVSAGISPGDRIAVTGKNSPEWAITYLATLFSGATVVPIDYQLHDDEIKTLVKASGARILAVDSERYETLAKLPVERVLSLSPEHPDFVLETADAAAPEDWGDTVPPAVPVARSGSDLAAILYTSGTTGRPKGVMLTHENFVADCFLAQANLSIYHTDVFYALLPIHHSYSMLAVFIESFSVGAETVFGKRMAITQIMHDLKTAGVTMFLGVPLLFNKLIAGILRGVREKGIVLYGIIRTLMGISGLVKKLTGINPGKKLFHSVLDKASLATIRICISGGGPLAPSVFRKYNQLGIDFVQGYGLTETSPILTLNPIDHYKEESVGRLIPEVDMQILEPDQRGAGEIAVKGPMVMQGYYEMPEETAEVFTEDGYFCTGDVGYLDSENYLYLTGRAKNLIVSEGGKNVYPEEIENEFQLYDEINQIMVRGYQKNRHDRVEEIEALVHPNEDFFKGDNTLPPDQIEARINEIVAEVNKRLQPYQRISRVTVRDEEMEMTSTKKIKRNTVE
ncbi:MAG: AMP-binding protein [Alkalispirochaeta sp.]